MILSRFIYYSQVPALPLQIFSINIFFQYTFSHCQSEKMSDPRLKQLKIKTGVLKRVGKEKLSYRKEADQQKAKIEKMKEEGREEVGEK